MTELAKPLPRLKKRQLSSKQKQLLPNQVGAAGEFKAAQFLLQKKYQIVFRNFQCSFGELDIVAIDPTVQELVFVEVKTRRSSTFGDPSLAVNWRKRQALRRTAGVFLRQWSWSGDYRFDIITVLPNSVDHYENVTW